MTPTPEQVAAWALEAGIPDVVQATNPPAFERFAALVDAHRAEQDAKRADYFANNLLAARTIAAAIRASVK